MKYRLLGLPILVAFPTLALSQIPGPPPDPEYFSAMSAIWQQVPLEPPPPALKPKGNVAELIWEQFQSDPSDRAKAATLSSRIVIRYDEEQHEAERIESPSPSGIATRTVSTYRNGRLESLTTEFSRKGKSEGPRAWSRWRYDAEGRVSDFQKGRDDSLENHFLNYQYDAQGRPIGWTYQQDEFATVTEIKYTGNTVETSGFDEHGAKTSMQVQALDPAGRVSDVRNYERSGKDTALKLLYHVRFQFDSEGRVTVQETDPYTVGEGDDYQPLPGKLVVRYDDAAHTREQRFYASNGTPAFRNVAELDREGLVCSLRVFDGTGTEQQQSELFPQAASKLPKVRPGKTRWEVTYDETGNWTERRRYFYPADGTDRLLMQLARQTIRYR